MIRGRVRVAIAALALVGCAAPPGSVSDRDASVDLSDTAFDKHGTDSWQDEFRRRHQQYRDETLPLCQPALVQWPMSSGRRLSAAPMVDADIR